MLNNIVLVGRMTRDPELRRTKSGVAVASFTLAVDRDYKQEGGDRACDFIHCVAWRGTAEFASRNFSKGQMAVVSGRLETRRYKDKDGTDRDAAEVVVDNLYFCGPKKTGEPTPYRSPYADKLDEQLPY